MRPHLHVAACALLALVGCEQTPDGGRGGDGGRAFDELSDRDADGLCDTTEEAAGTDPDALDSDADGYPDLFEVLIGTNDDTGLPGAQDVVFLSASRGAQVEHEVRVTVDGGGEGHSGAFDALQSPYPDATAADFYVGALAVSAEPPDHVRGLDAAAERFGTVLGSTRLSFSLSFLYDDGVAPHPDCRRGYPFAYRVKAEGDIERNQAIRLLVVEPPGLEVDGPFCFPAECL